MGKYTRLTQDILSLFGTSTWVAEGIKVVPQNFVGDTVVTEYLRVSVVPSGAGVNGSSTSGLLLIDIFSPVGSGPSRSAALADKLDSYLLGKSFNTGVSGSITQISKTSNFRITGTGESTYCHAIYQVQFNHFQMEV